jgi:hypothetical protein
MLHPAAYLLNKLAQFGCPAKTGCLWTKEKMWEAVKRGPHCSALPLDGIAHFAAEATEKVHTNQAQLVNWDDIKHNPPRELKISPIAAIPHKSWHTSNLDLSFCLCLKNGEVLLAVNDTTEKTTPKGLIDQFGYCLLRIVHTISEAEEDAKIFMAKWDVKDGFWIMDCKQGRVDFLYVLLQEEGHPIQLVVPTLLQMGWVESSPYFCAATEMAQDVATNYIETLVNLLPQHRLEKYVVGDAKYNSFQRCTMSLTALPT